MIGFPGRRALRIPMTRVKQLFSEYVNSIQGVTGLSVYKYNPKESKEVSKFQTSPKIRANLPQKIRKDV